MTQIKRQWDKLSDERRKKRKEEIIAFFKKERGEEIGLIAADEILDFFLQNAGEDVYNKGIEDAKQLLKKRFEDLEVDLEVMKTKLG